MDLDPSLAGTAQNGTGERPPRPLPCFIAPDPGDRAYGLRSMQDTNFGLLSSSTGTGKFTSGPYWKLCLKYAPVGNTVLTGRLYWRTRRRMSLRRVTVRLYLYACPRLIRFYT